MKKRGMIFHCITFMVFCQRFLRNLCPSGVASKIKTGVFILLASLLGQGVLTLPGAAASEGQEVAIKDHCEAIREDLGKVQKEDSRTRVYLGAYYEMVLTKMITPLNVKLVEGNLSNAGLVENQNNFAATKVNFADDFVNYQKELEGLIGMDCKAEPGKFYERLVKVREKRKVVEQDVLKLRRLISDNVKLVTKVREKV